MKQEKGMEKRTVSIAKRLAFSAVFAALCCVATVVIVVPLPYGYFNLGDVFVLLAGWCLGPLYGAAAEAWMVFGYFTFESILYCFAGGAASLAGNALQGGFCIVCALFLVSVFYRVKPVKRIFPMLGLPAAANRA